MTRVLIQAADSLPKLYKVAYDLFCSHRHQPWQYKTFVKALLMPNSVIAIVDGKFAGYMLVSEVVGEVEIEDVCVQSVFRQTGVASSMFSYVIAQSEKHCADYIFLEVASRNSSALALYKKMGFETISVRNSYYVLANEQFDDAVLMRKGLKN